MSVTRNRPATQDADRKANTGATHPSLPPLSAALPDLMFLTVAAFAALPGQAVLLNRDGDLARHITNGEEILRVGPYVRDVVSHTRPGEPFMGHEWLSQVSFAVSHYLGGIPMVTVTAVLVLALVYALIARYLIARRVSPLRAAIAVMGAIVLGATHWAARPHLFSMLGLVILLPMLRGRSGRWWHWALLFVVWANFHPGFVLGLALAGAAAAGTTLDGLVRGAGPPRVRYARATRLATGVAAGAAASLVNPWGIALHLDIVHILGNEYIRSISNEFQPPGFDHWVGWFFFASLALLAVGLIPFARRIRFTSLVPILLLVAAGFSARRNVSLFALIAIPLAVIEIDRGLRLHARARRHARGVFGSKAPHARPRLVFAPILAALLLVLGAARGQVAGVRVIGDSFDGRMFPVEAVRHLRAAGIDGRIFNDFVWGGYMMYAWPEQRVFIDGMTPFFGEEIAREYFDVITVQGEWREVLDRRGIDLVFIRPQRKLGAALIGAGWAPVYLDSTAVLLRAPHSPVRGCNDALPCNPGQIVTGQ